MSSGLSAESAPVAGDPARSTKATAAEVRRITWSSFIGNTIEYYDFLVYGTASALVFPKLFFPEFSSLAGTLASFATFGVGFLARPLGGIFFGHRGDTSGRKSTLVLTLVMMGLATFLIGALPTFAQIGMLAPVLLVALRFVQGFAVGGEWGGAMLMVIENAPVRRRAFLSAWPNTGGFSAQLLATGLFALVGFLPEDQLLSWGWRLPFMASLVLVAIGLYLRRRLNESPVFADLQSGTAAQSAAPSRHPVLDMFRDDWRTLLMMIPLRFAEAVPFFLLTVFVLSYGSSTLHVPKNTLLTGVIIASVLAFPAHGIFGALSDRFGRRPIYALGAVVGAVMTVPFFLLLQSKNTMLIILGYVLVINLGHNAINAVQPAWFTELFGAKVRYSGAAAGREIASILAGGFTPTIAAALVAAGHGSWTWVALYVVVVCAATAVAAYFTRETYRDSVEAADSPDPFETGTAQ